MPKAARKKIGKVVLVTGTSSGFGLLAAIALARRGHWVFASMRNPSKAEALRDAATQAGIKIEENAPPLTLVPLDVTRNDSIHRAVHDILGRVHRLDVVINNAGIGLGGFFEDMDEADLRDVMETNFFGAVALIREVAPIMRKQGYGRIINVTSIGGRVPLPGMTAYSASKFALEGLSESLRYELKPFGVEVVLVEPGTFKTDIFTSNRRMARHAESPTSPYKAVTEKVLMKVYERVEKLGGDPQRVADRIARVVEARSTRLRYTVGLDAKTEAFLRWLLPSSVPDLIAGRVLRSFGLGRKTHP
ncbi:MAG: SDR family oxidoreductase [Nitrospirae bacterium]|nr:SDR family oxidoreductase [Nitrospirota bacterium]